MVFIKLKENDMNAGVRGISAGIGAVERQKRRRRANDKSRLVRMNVSGREFFIHESDLKLYPETLLGSSDIEDYFLPALNCYFFDRNRIVFEYIASFYQTGALALPNELDSKLINDELAFFRLNDEGESEVSSVDSIPGTVKERMHLFLNYPSYSWESGIWAAVDMGMILTGILLYCLETEPTLVDHFTDPNDKYYDFLWWLQTSITLFFSIDLILRAISWPNIWTFFNEPINLLDFVSIIPFYVQYILDALHVTGQSGVLISLGKLFRMIRVVRVVKFFRYFKEMFLIMQFIAQAWQEIVLIICLTSMLLVIFGSILYNVEHGNNEQFYSIAQGFWWSLTTITTVGYGDICPKTWLGQLSGSILVIFSLVVLTLPMTIIITKFNYAYEVKKRNFKRSKLSPVIQSEDEDNNEADNASPRVQFQIRSEALVDVTKTRTNIRHDTWRDVTLRDVPSHGSAEDIRDGLPWQRKVGHVRSDVSSSDLTSLDSVEDISESMLINKDKYLYTNTDGASLRDPHV